MSRTKHHAIHANEEAPQPTRPLRLLRLPQVLERVSVGEGTWLAAVRAGTAPKPIRVMPVAGAGGAVAWVEHEVEGWIASRIAAERET